MNESIFIKVEGIFRDIFDDEELSITYGTNADDIEDWDSLEQINILTAIEQEFGIKFKIDDVLNLENVGDIVALVERLI